MEELNVEQLSNQIESLNKKLDKTQKQKKKVIFLCVLLAFTTCLSFAFYLQQVRPASAKTDLHVLTAEDLNERNKAQKALLEALDWLKGNYFEEMDYRSLADKMLFGALEKMGNKFTRYLPEEEYAAFKENLSGEFYGIGVQVQSLAEPVSKKTEPTDQGEATKVENQEADTQEVGEELIKRVFPNSPAEKAGLLVGDIIRKIDGKPLKSFSQRSEVIQAVRGASGTTVELEIYRQNTKETLNFNIERGPVLTPVTQFKQLKDVAYIRLYEFTTTLPAQFEQALLEVKEKGIKKVIFDMRFNPGGDAGALEQVLDMLLPQGLIATIEGREQGHAYVEEWKTHEGQILDTDVRFAILMNGESASASEFFMGALRDRLDVPLIGTSSFGKGVATVSLPLSNGGAINVTTFEYILPKGERLNGVGLEPTQRVELEEAYRLLDPENIPEGKDTQLLEALKYLNKK